MHAFSYVRAIVGVGRLAIAMALCVPVAQSQTPNGESTAAAKGVKCPEEYQSIYDASTAVLRCQREVVSWVVTRCLDKDFSTYKASPGADSCGPTEIPGVGAPPGSSGSRPASCSAPGYAMVLDRTGPRDRCERIERLFALPKPVS
jgi:hypothetical protein